jgi:hypothetical protein
MMPEFKLTLTIGRFHLDCDASLDRQVQLRRERFERVRSPMKIGGVTVRGRRVWLSRKTGRYVYASFNWPPAAAWRD